MRLYLTGLSTADADRNTKNTSRPKSQKESGSPTRSMDITTPVSLGGGKPKENQQTTMDNFTARVKQAHQIARKEALENDGWLVGDVQVTVHNYVPMGGERNKI
jgi:hypothetical protein